MTAVVLAFAGTIGSGKSTVSAAVAAALGWPRTSFGDYVRKEAQRQGLDASSREVLQAIGEQLLAAGWEPFCRSVLAQVAWVPGESLVIDGIRHVRAVETLRTLVAPAQLFLIYLQVSDAIREPRLRQRGILDNAHRQRIEEHSTEAEVPILLLSVADVQISTDAPQAAVVQRIIDWLGRPY